MHLDGHRLDAHRLDANPDPDLDRHQHGNSDPEWHQNVADPQHWMNQRLLNVPFKRNVRGGGNFVTEKNRERWCVNCMLPSTASTGSFSGF